MIIRENIDLFLTDDGDFMFDENESDLKVIDNKNNELLINVVKRRLKSSSYDWDLESQVVSNLDYVKGLYRDSNSLNVLRGLVENCLREDLLIMPQDFQVEIIGMIEDMIGVGVIIYDRDRDYNSTIQLGFSYDYRENRFSPIKEYKGF